MRCNDCALQGKIKQNFALVRKVYFCTNSKADLRKSRVMLSLGGVQNLAFVCRAEAQALEFYFRWLVPTEACEFLEELSTLRAN